MSDPVTNVEIEDILSSIRRLVSDEDRSDETEEKPDENRLVLTPSLRVHAPEDADDADDGTGDDAAAPPSAEEVPEAAATDPVEDGASDDVQSSDTDAHDDVEPEGLRARIAALEESVASRADQWEPDGHSDDDYAGGPVEALPWEDHFEDDDEPLDEEQLNEELTEEAPAQTAQYADEDTEAAEHDWPLGHDDAIAGEQDAQDTASHTEDAESEAPVEEAADQGSGAAVAEMNELLGGDDAIVDEEALREVIADIVRQELQGSLGERITRNVRKLVRREIHRALASHDLE